VNADGTVQFEANEASDVVHHGVECDISGMNPVVGPRYHKIGCDYDLCEAEFCKLDKCAKRAFERIDGPGARAVRMGSPDDDLNPAAVNEELEARHGWSIAAVSAVQSSALASTCETLSTILPAEQFHAVVSTIDPIFAVPEPFLVPCLNKLEPYVAAVTMPLDQEQLGLISNVVAAITEDPEAVAKSLPPAAPLPESREYFDAHFLDMMDIAGAYERPALEQQDKNDWHFVTISPSADGAHLMWQNRAGIEWALHPTEDHLIYRVSDSCPYFDEGHTQVTVTLDETGAVQALSGPAEEVYSKTTHFQAPSPTVVDHDVFPVDEPEPATGQELNCPGGHGLQRLTAHCDGMYCDGCRVSIPKGDLLHGCRQCDFDFCEACFNKVGQEQEPVRMQTLAEIGIDLSASMLLEIEEMEQVANMETEAEQASAAEAERAVAEAEVEALVAEVEAAADDVVQDTPVSMAAAMAAMGVGENDLSASMCAAIEHALDANAEQAEAAAMELSAKEAEAEKLVAEAEAAAESEKIASEAEAEKIAAEAEAKAEAKAEAEKLVAEAEATAEAEKIAAEAEAEAVAEAEKLVAEAEAAAEAEKIAAEAEAKAEAEKLVAEAEAAAEAEKIAAEAEAKAAAEKLVAEAEAAAEAEKIAAEAEAKAAAEVADPEMCEDAMMHPLVEQLLKMGFARNEASNALATADGNLEQAVNTLLSMPCEGAVPVPEPDPIVEDSTEWNNDWDELLAELDEMGFDNVDANRAILALTNGDVKDAVKELVNQERISRQ